MHCHTKEGSMDGKVSMVQFAATLKEKGFDGMLVSDHNSYNGYRAWKRYLERVNTARPDEGSDMETVTAMEQEKKWNLAEDFVVLKGIEYDTIDAGHILVIMPAGSRLRILELRGLPVQLLIEIVHRNGGILGPAHPCGEKYLSITNTRKHRHQLSVMDKFDFLEGFNACESPESNRGAMELAEEFQKPAFGGSDAHKADCIGLAYTEFKQKIHNESDVIACVRECGRISCGGEYYTGTTKEKLGAANKVLVQFFWVYNRMGSLWRHRKRKMEMRRLQFNHFHYKHDSQKRSG